MEDDVAPPLPTLEPISRPSSASTTESQAVAQLPSIAALATGSVTSSPQPRATNAPTAVMSSATSPGATVPLASGGMPTCMNCQTSTTPLWRRDEMGAVLCNACGLFLKLHGRPRPISLKTDVIKSRNRVKTMRPDMQMKKKQSLPAATAPVNHNGMMQAHDTTSTALAAVQRATQGKTNGHGADENSPGSRNGTPSMYDPHLPVFQGMDPNQFQSSSMPRYPMPGGSPGQPGSPSNGDPTQEQLISENAGLKTRVSELDLINELYRSRLTQLEHDSQTQDNYRHQAEVATKNEAHERAMREEIQRDFERTHRQLEESHRRENILKRRLDEMEQELKDVHDRLDQFEHLGHADSDRPSKRPRLDPDLLNDESTAMADMIDGAITGEAGAPAHDDAPDQDGDDKVGQLEQVHQVDQVPEVEQHSQAEQLPEAEQLSKSDQLPEADQLPKADAIPEAEQIPEPEHDPESERIPEAEHMPDVEHPDVEHLPVVEHLPEAGYIPEHIPEAEHNPQAEQTTEVGQLPQDGQMTEAEPLPQADPMHPAEHILADDHVDNMEQAEHLNNHVDGHIDQVDEPMDLSALQQD